MTVTDDLDTWAAPVEGALGIRVDRDPATATPPCVYVAMPEAQTVTVGEVLALDLPVFLVAEGDGGKLSGDYLLNMLPAFLTAVDARQASPVTVQVVGSEFPAYQTTVRLHLTGIYPTP
jgi:hypothetical protein